MTLITDEYICGVLIKTRVEIPALHNRMMTGATFIIDTCSDLTDEEKIQHLEMIHLNKQHVSLSILFDMKGCDTGTLIKIPFIEKPSIPTKYRVDSNTLVRATEEKLREIKENLLRLAISERFTLVFTQREYSKTEVDVHITDDESNFSEKVPVSDSVIRMLFF